jgi:ribokinase
MEGEDYSMNYDLICIGSLSLDSLLEAPFLPDVYSECFVERLRDIHGGAAANVAAYASLYGGLKVGLVSRIGNDEIGEELVMRMREYGVDTRGIVKSKESPSTTITTIQHPEGGRRHLVHLGALKRLSTVGLPDEYVESSSMFYIAPSTPESHKEFVRAAIDHKKPLAFNPGSVYFEQEPKSSLHGLMKYVEFLFVNEQEALRYSMRESVEAAGHALLGMGAKYVIVTQNDLGCCVFSQGKYTSYPAHEAKPVCTIGAGDAFTAGFLSTLIKGGSIETAAQVGNIYGAFGVMRLELRSPAPDRAEFVEFLRRVRSDFLTTSQVHRMANPQG